MSNMAMHAAARVLAKRANVVTAQTGHIISLNTEGLWPLLCAHMGVALAEGVASGDNPTFMPGFAWRVASAVPDTAVSGCECPAWSVASHVVVSWLPWPTVVACTASTLSAAPTSSFVAAMPAFASFISVTTSEAFASSDVAGAVGLLASSVSTASLAVVLLASSVSAATHCAAALLTSFIASTSSFAVTSCVVALLVVSLTMSSIASTTTSCVVALLASFVSTRSSMVVPALCVCVSSTSVDAEALFCAGTLGGEGVLKRCCIPAFVTKPNFTVGGGSCAADLLPLLGAFGCGGDGDAFRLASILAGCLLFGGGGGGACGCFAFGVGDGLESGAALVHATQQEYVT